MKILLKAQASFYLFSVSLPFAKLLLTSSCMVFAVWSGMQPGRKAVGTQARDSCWRSWSLGACGHPQVPRTGSMHKAGSAAKPSTCISLNMGQEPAAWGQQCARLLFGRVKVWAMHIQWLVKEVVWLLSQTGKMHSWFRPVPWKSVTWALIYLLCFHIPSYTFFPWKDLFSQPKSGRKLL